MLEVFFIQIIKSHYVSIWIFTGPRPQLTHNQGRQRRHTAQHRACTLTKRCKWLLDTCRTIPEGLMQMGSRLRTIEMDATVCALVTNMPKNLPAARRWVIQGLIYATTQQNGTKHAENTEGCTATARRPRLGARSCDHLGDLL